MLMQLHPSMLKWICLQAIYNISKPSLIFTPTLKAGELYKPREKKQNLVHHLPTSFGTAKAQAINTS